MQLRLPQPQDVQGKTVLVRVDYNVPLVEDPDHAGQRRVGDDQRVQASLRTLHFLREHQAKIILISHLGRPKGAPTPEFSLQPVAHHLSEVLTQPVGFVDDCVGETVTTAVGALQPGQILLLENLRFHAEEKANDPNFARRLVSSTGAEIYINEAFSACHRAHASTEGVTHLLPSFAGFALQDEVTALSTVIDNPARPFVVVIGGAKISDKVEAVVNLAHLADVVLLGGGVANTFLKADGLEIHKSYLQDAPADLKKKGIDYVHVAQDLLSETKLEKVWLDGFIPLPKILYPLDLVAAPALDSTTTQTVDLTHDAADTPNDQELMYLDIGPKTIHLYEALLKDAQTIFWNGPMGVFEQPQFATGTKAIATAIANNPHTTVLGGGDTLAAVAATGVESKFKYISTAGGASLEFLAGKQLPGLAPLQIQ
ncbi:MAG TPA: phosphoglycerate kinase [Vitreimonas sp.]|nr:phosphoglycerate kinase [Vitreimonas sp.]